MDDRLQAAKTPEQKGQLYQVFFAYLQTRAQELRDEGGEDSPVYKRESQFMQEVATDYKLVATGTPTASEQAELPATPSPEAVDVIDLTPVGTSPAPAGLGQPSIGVTQTPAPVSPPPTLPPVSLEPATPTLSGEMEKLIGMLEKGYITPEEFQEMKRKLIDRYGT